MVGQDEQDEQDVSGPRGLTSNWRRATVDAVFTRLANIALIIALLAATGAHWALLQSAAWTAMLASNLRSHSLADAVEKTFDGKHPCCLCKRISAGKKSEKKPEFPLSSQRLEFILKDAVFVFAAPRDYQLLPEATFAIPELAHEPPTPPPRFLPG